MRPVAIDDVFKLKYLSEISFSPEGTSACFVVSEADMKKNGGKYVEYAGEVKEIDAVYRRLVFMDKTEIPLDVIVNISLE